MPTFQVYLPSKIAGKVYDFAKEDGIDDKEWIQRAVGKEVSRLTNTPIEELLEKQRAKKPKKEKKRAIN